MTLIVREYPAVNDNSPRTVKTSIQEMKEAVALMQLRQAEFQKSMAVLDHSMEEIETNMKAYNKNLGNISGSLERTAQLSRNLEDMMDDYLHGSS